MIQKCPNCGNWCEAEAESSGGTGGAMGGAAVGAAAGSFLPGIGTVLGGIVGGVAGALMSDSDEWNFTCPECGHSWTVEYEELDETDDYNNECAWKNHIHELVGETSSLCNASNKQKTEHIKELQSELSGSDIDSYPIVKGVLYDALAYSQLVLLKDSNAALNTIKQSLNLFPEDPTSLAIQGMISGVSKKPLDNYIAMQSLVNYKNIQEGAISHFTPAQFGDRFCQLATSYSDNFLSIPINNRRYLVIDDELRYLPGSFVVLQQDMVPRDISFPSGHPRSKELYVVHPYKPNVYIPFNEYQLSLFRDELKEFSWIMECLGAKSISFHETQSDEAKRDSNYSTKTQGDAEYTGYSAKGSYDRGEIISEYKKLSSELKEAKEFCITPNTPPYIPNDVFWYQHRPDWHRNCESRKVGRLAKASFNLSTNSITTTSEQERKNIEADLKILLFKANGSHEQEEQVSLHREENHTWSVDVEFYPLEEYNTSSKIPMTQPQAFVAQQPATNSVKSKSNFLIIVLLALIVVLLGIILTIVL